MQAGSLQSVRRLAGDDSSRYDEGRACRRLKEPPDKRATRMARTLRRRECLLSLHCGRDETHGGAASRRANGFGINEVRFRTSRHDNGVWVEFGEKLDQLFASAPLRGNIFHHAPVRGHEDCICRDQCRRA